MSSRASFQIVLLLISLSLAPSFARAEAPASEKWVASTDNNEFYFAVSMNEAAHLLGQYCYLDSRSCYYLVAFSAFGLNAPCKEGKLYPVLVSTELGAEHMNVICSHGSGGKPRLVLDNFDVVDRLVRNASKIGFAMALNNDQFKVSRFDLTGAAHAIDIMRAAAEKKVGAVFKRGLLPAEAFM